MKYLFWSVGTIALILAMSSWFFLNTVRQPESAVKTTTTFVVNDRDKVRAVAAHLYQQHLISAPWKFNLYVLLIGARSSLQKGTYVFPAHQSIRQIVHALTIGPNPDNVWVTIKEGQTNLEIAELLGANQVMARNVFLDAVKQPASLPDLKLDTYAWLPNQLPTSGLEGFLFPDTYNFFKNSTASQVLKKFLDNFDRKFSTDLRQATTTSGHSVYEEVIMASILEAELQSARDRAMAADIFWRRIGAGTGLNADTTVLFAIGKKNHVLTAADLQIDSPYNTYRNRGLPPGPIGNPGLSALEAAVHPVANEYWYYLTAPSGQTIFAKTLEEQAQNKKKYLGR